jgi:hypothetical protein
MDDIMNLTPLSPENDALFWKIWEWLSARGATKGELPQVTSDEFSYHVDGLIGIHEGHDKNDFPLGAVMLEELLHYATSSDDPKTSADFSPAFLHRILDLILGDLSGKPHEPKRAFQSILIVALWKLIEKGAGAELAAGAQPAPTNHPSQ